MTVVQKSIDFKAPIDTVFTYFARPEHVSDQMSENLKLLNSIQPLFELTGGTHAAVAFDNKGDVIASREDVGRHNALDKLIGHMLRNGGLHTEDSILQVSGRSSFELVQKY